MSTTRSREAVEADLRALQAEIIEEFGHLSLTVLRSRAEASGLAAELREVSGPPPVATFPPTPWRKPQAPAPVLRGPGA